MTFIINILIWIVSAHSAPIRECSDEIELIDPGNSSKPISPKDCYQEIKYLAEKRNIFYIRPVSTSDPITMPCNTCDSTATPSLVKWYFIKRNSLPLINFEYDMVEGSYLRLLQTGNPVINGEIYCLTSQKGLKIKSFDPDKVLGTYYCESDRVNISRFIWHHVDTFYESDDPNLSKLVVTYPAKSSSKVNGLLNDIEDELNRTYSSLLHESNLLKIFYNFDSRPTSKGLCGDLKLKYVRRCFLQIPLNITESRPLTNAELGNYVTLLEAMKLIFEYKGKSEQTDGRMFVALKQKADVVAESFGFKLNDKINDIVIPCHFSFLKHWETVPNLGNPFGRFNPYGVVAVVIKCPEINPMDIIKLAMARDIGQLKIKILGEVQKSMRTVDKLYLQGSENEKLICGFSKAGSDVCTNKRSDIQWRKDDFVFSIQSIVKQRVYVQSDCQLLFTEIRLRDRGIYQCFRKSSDKKSWSFHPTTKFLIQVERSKNPIPDMKEVAKYFTVLLMWTIFIFALWFILSVINIRIKVNARYRAEERKMLFLTQDRRKNKDLQRKQNPDNLNVTFDESEELKESSYDKKID